MKDYVELRCRSAFSFLRGASAPEDLVTRAARLEMDALALCDCDGVYGLPRFHFAARQAGLRPLLGAELSLAEGGSLVLLVRSRRGWHNLCRLLTAGHCRPDVPAGARRPPQGRARLALERLAGRGDGLVCLAGSALLQARRAGGAERVQHLLGSLRALFGPEGLWIEVCRCLDRAGAERNRFLADLAAAAGVGLVASNDVRYGRRRERRLLDVFTCLQRRLRLDEAGRLLEGNAERHLKSPQRMAELFAALPEAVANTRRVAELCEFSLDDLDYRFPDFATPPGESQVGLLRRLVWRGAARRYRPLGSRQRRQLAHELAVIERLGLAGYFLVVWDICRFCREQGIMVQGRGSAANSAVCYCLGITAVDPVGMDLLFERFLSAERGQWPDIDLDLPSGERRERVIQYVWQRYGRQRAAMTANVITYRWRSAVRQVGKVLGLPEEYLARLLQQLPGSDGEPDLAGAAVRAGLDPGERRVRWLLQLAPRLQHLPRHLGQHSGGMVLCAGRLDEVVPIEPASMTGRTVIQWDKDDCGDLGILKVDLLGLGMLRALEQARWMLRQRGQRFDLAHLPAGDPRTYELLRRADTIGVFQVESRAQMNILPRLRPRCFYDLVVQVAIIRPGPIVGRKVHPYLERRAGRQPVTYPHPALEPILKRTLGIPLFQEQSMRIAMTAAGYSLRQAEQLRRAMGHRRSPEYRRWHQQQLRRGLHRHGIRGRAAEEIVASFASFFGLYGFPESHAASFALIVYASAYLKAHHPEVFAAALLNAWPLGFYHPATIVADAQRHGVSVRPADVNHSTWLCRVEADGGLRLGLRFVRGLRQQAGRQLAAERRRGRFTSLAGLQRRVELRQRELVALASLGALGSLGLTRRQALWQASALGQQRPLLRHLEQPAGASPLAEMSALECTTADLSLSGISCGPHPLAYLRRRLRRRRVLAAESLDRPRAGDWVRVAGMVIVRQRPATARGMTFLTLEDETGLVNVTITPDLWPRVRLQVVSARALLVAGRLERRDGVVGVRGQVFESLDEDLAGFTPARDFH